MTDLTTVAETLPVQPGNRIRITSGFYAGRIGYFHELDETDPDLPYGVEFGSLLVWFGPGQIEVAE